MFPRKASKGVLLGGVAALVLAGSTAVAVAGPPPIDYPYPPMPDPLSIGGQTVTGPDPGPVVALYKKKNGFICGGVVIAPDTVLTAAHCTTTPPASETDAIAPSDGLTIRAGNTDRTAGTIHRVTQVAAPADWTWGAGEPGQRVGDISVLHLETPVQGVVPARITGLDPHQLVDVIGWGFQVQPPAKLAEGMAASVIEPVVPGGLPFPVSVPDVITPPTRLNTVSLRAVDASHCRPSGPADPGIGPGESCLASQLLGITNPCHGDSGTPGLQDGAVVALVSRGTEAPCVAGNTIVTNPADYLDWIETTITAQQTAAGEGEQ